MLKTALFTFCLLLPWISNAGLKDAFEVYTTNPATTFDGRYMQGVVGASFHARNRNLYDRDIFSVQAPSYSGGCGGVDFFSGAFSAITKDEIVQIARGIAQGAPGYFFQLSISSICPSCSAEMKELASRLNSWNAMAQDSCQTFWDKSVEMTGNQSLTQRINSNINSKVQTDSMWDGIIDDYSSWMTTKSSETNTTNAVNDSTTAAQVQYMENNAIKKLFERADSTWSDNLTIDLTVWELYMSLFGSAIVTIEDDAGNPIPTISITPASVDLRSFLLGPEQGSPAQISLTRCVTDGSDPECLYTVNEDEPWEGLVPQFSSLIYNNSGTGILQLMNKRQNLSVQQIKFINTYPFAYIDWAHNCYITAGAQIANYVANQVAFSVAEDVLMEVQKTASLNLINDGLQPEHMITPDQIEKQVSLKMEEFNALKTSRQDQWQKAQEDLALQISIALSNNSCNSI